MDAGHVFQGHVLTQQTPGALTDTDILCNPKATGP